MTDRRTINVSLTMKTTHAPDDVRLRILAAIGDLDGLAIDHVSAVDLDDIKTGVEAQLVICPVRGILAAYVGDEGRADDHAKREGAVVADLSTTADHRGEVTA